MTMIADPITAALNELKFTIPLPILQKVFIRRVSRWQAKHVSLNERIMEEVIRPRVFQDTNIAYGQTIFVDLSLCPVEQVQQYATVYRIPKELTHGRSILSALSVAYGIPGTGAVIGGMVNAGKSAIQAATNALARSQEQMPVTSTANVQLIAENTILIRDTLRMTGNLYLRCVIEQDERMSHLHYKNIPVLKQLVTYAVKSFIYNTYLIEMDMAELAGGQELGRFSDIIESYADAEELYQETLKEKYARAAVSTDYPAIQRYIKLMAGGYR